MPVVPSKDLEAIQFFEIHQPIWENNHAAVGLSLSQCTVLTDLTKTAREAYTAQQEAKTAAKTATNAFHTAVAALRSDGADLIAAIKAFADTSDNPGVYDIAQIPPPAPPAPLPPPGQPNSFTATLSGSGAIHLAWKSTNSASSGGVYFTINRRLTGESTYTLIGNIGGKKFTDNTIPSSAGGATYLVQGFRGLTAGPVSDGFTIQFGVGGAGFIASVMKIAA